MSSSSDSTVSFHSILPDIISAGDFTAFLSLRTQIHSGTIEQRDSDTYCKVRLTVDSGSRNVRFRVIVIGGKANDLSSYNGDIDLQGYISFEKDRPAIYTKPNLIVHSPKSDPRPHNFGVATCHFGGLIRSRMVGGTQKLSRAILSVGIVKDGPDMDLVQVCYRGTAQECSGLLMQHRPGSYGHFVANFDGIPNTSSSKTDGPSFILVTCRTIPLDFILSLGNEIIEAERALDEEALRPKDKKSFPAKGRAPVGETASTHGQVRGVKRSASAEDLPPQDVPQGKKTRADPPPTPRPSQSTAGESSRKSIKAEEQPLFNKSEGEDSDEDANDSEYGSA